LRTIDTALVMAGGSGQRMQLSGISIPKPLVTVLGVTLLERNVYALLRAQIRRIIVAVPSGLQELQNFVSGRLTILARAAGAEIICWVEQTPLGNIGCAGLFRDVTDTLLVVYADNLTTLDLRMVGIKHIQSGADITIATHKQSFRMPFGEVRIEGEEVLEYIEKPTYHFNVCSAISVLGRAAINALPADRPTGLSEVVGRLLSTGRKVRSVPHAAPWIDVNDATAIPIAEAIITDHQPEFDLWASRPGESQKLLCETAGNYVRLSPPRETGSPGR
jgi:NDP-sugar pyrophosphorylase family protein